MKRHLSSINQIRNIVGLKIALFCVTSLLKYGLLRKYCLLKNGYIFLLVCRKLRHSVTDFDLPQTSTTPSYAGCLTENSTLVPT